MYINFTKTKYNNKTICLLELLVLFVMLLLLLFQKEAKKNSCHTIFSRISHSSYFHHIFQSHAEYLDYLNRFFTSFFFLLLLHLFFIRIYVCCLRLSIDEERRKITNNVMSAAQWHSQISLALPLKHKIERAFEKKEYKFTSAILWFAVKEKKNRRMFLL